jgi:hypothetical protein
MEIKTKQGLMEWTPASTETIKNIFTHSLMVLSGLARHILVSDKPIDILKKEDDMYGTIVEITEVSYVLHMDPEAPHHPIELEPGVYHFYPQQEYNPFTEAATRVFD